jgi:Transglutaminase-like superfamily/Coenzyme PQQ synthesis protein D (PqqD)
MMAMPKGSTPDSPHPNTARAREHRDGSIVLSIAEDRVCKLNGVGALTWMVLEDIPASLTVEEIVRALEQQFDAINAEGELCYQVSHEQLQSDTESFLGKMASMGLVAVSQDSRGQKFYAVKNDVSATTSAPSAPVDQSEKIDAPCEDVGQTAQFSKRETLTAFVGLFAFDLLVKFAGFDALIKKVESWPTAEPRKTHREICRRVRTTVDRAQMYYPKKAMCLQHAAVVTCLLRRRGVPAQLVLGAQEFPPKAHAWSEVMNEVVSDSPRVKGKYRELRRL